MSKRKKADPNPEKEDDEEETTTNSRSQIPQKVYDFHKKTIEVYPERLLDLNQQFLASISSQIKTEPYSVLVGNCLDYVRQYFKYEDDLLQYSPWLATRLKQSRSDIVKCLQETIDVYEALARHDFDRLVEKNNSNSTEVRSTSSSTPLFSSSKQNEITKTINNDTGFGLAKSTPTSTNNETGFSLAKSTPTTTSSETGFSLAKSTPTTTSSETGFSLAKSTPTTTSSETGFSFGKSTTTTTSSETGFSFAKPVTTTTSSETGFSFAKPVTTTTSSETGFSFGKSTTTTTSSETGFSFAKPVTTTTSSETVPAGSFSFKLPSSSSSTASPEKAANPAPFSFSIPNTGFGTPIFGNSSTTEKSTFSFATPSKISFTPPTTTITSGDQGGANEDNEDEAIEPPEPEKVEHESDAKLTYRCRMGVNKSGKLIKRGPVQVILKEVNDKRQLIVRSDDTLGRLYLNILWSKLIELKKNSTKDVTFICKLNPGMPEVAEGDFVMILFRFDNETDRNDAYEKLDKERS